MLYVYAVRIEAGRVRILEERTFVVAKWLYNGGSSREER